MLIEIAFCLHQIDTAIPQYVKLRLSYKVAYTVRLIFSPIEIHGSSEKNYNWVF